LLRCALTHPHRLWRTRLFSFLGVHRSRFLCLMRKLLHFKKAFEYFQVFPQLSHHPFFQNSLVHTEEIHYTDPYGYGDPCAIISRVKRIGGMQMQGAGQ